MVGLIYCAPCRHCRSASFWLVEQRVWMLAILCQDDGGRLREKTHGGPICQVAGATAHCDMLRSSTRSRACLALWSSCQGCARIAAWLTRPARPFQNKYYAYFFTKFYEPMPSSTSPMRSIQRTSLLLCPTQPCDLPHLSHEFS